MERERTRTRKRRGREKGKERKPNEEKPLFPRNNIESRIISRQLFMSNVFNIKKYSGVTYLI